MDKRTFLKTTALAGLATMVQPQFLWAGAARPTQFELPRLPYAPEALAPYIDQETMHIHHGKHHAAYVNNLNKALEGRSNQRYDQKGLEQLLQQLKPEEAALRNNAGGHYNHSLFWEILSPKPALSPSAKLAQAIDASFGSLAKFKEAFAQRALNRFGSGWAWLSVDASGKLFLSDTANQDNPLMHHIVAEKGVPVMGLDVWEHAYYLQYQNRRAEYVSAFWNILDWQKVSTRYELLLKQQN
ncbi:Fe-Mn family superoxide dismutase [Eisenibacter elegans]|jgi:Fe-Mn family superoxide dismutase|uniref:Fe-Mn family superoxide dismutase n=1 Tax=Eisenibacter elegans TaxID=997 RepID=UPI00041AE46C